MSLRAIIGLRTHMILVVFLIATIVSAFERSAGQGISRTIRFIIVIAVLTNAIAEPWIRALTHIPDASHGEGFQRAARRLTMAALLAGLVLGLWMTKAGYRIPHRPLFALAVLVRDVSFFMLVLHASAVFAWSRLMRSLSGR